MEALLEHAQWLRRLAASLVANDGEDLVQDAYVAAMRLPPTGEPRPWLARVVRNAARFRFRSDANRARRELAAMAEDHAPSSEELLARHQLQQKLGELVEQLAEPFRTAILLRFAEGLTPKQIAKREGIPDGTARYRISEGVSRLRAALDAAHGGDRKKWLLALAPIALWPRRSAAAPVAVACTVAAIAVVAVIPAASSPSRKVGENEHRAVAAPVSVSTVPPISISPTFLVQPGAPSRHLSGRVVRAGAPVANALVRLVADGEPDVELHADANGRFDLGDQPPRLVALGATAGDALAAIRHVDLRDPTAAPYVELELLDCPAHAEGRVVDGNDNPIAGARVLRESVIGTTTDATGGYRVCTRPMAAFVGELELTVRADGYGSVVAGVATAGLARRDFVLAPEATITGSAAAGALVSLAPLLLESVATRVRPASAQVTAGADGRFALAGVAGGRYRISAAARGQGSDAAAVDVLAGGSADLALAMHPTATVHGRLLNAGGGVRVGLALPTSSHDTDEPVLLGGFRDRVHAGAVAVTQADGTFVLDGLAPGDAAFAASTMRVTSKLHLVAGDNRIELTGDPLATLRGRVLHDGQPVAFTRINLVFHDGAMTDRDGRFAFAGLEPGNYQLFADDGHRLAFGGGAVRVDQADVEHDVELTIDARVSGTVVDTTGAPLAGVAVRFNAMRGGETVDQSRCATDAVGAFTCGGMWGGGQAYTASVYPVDADLVPWSMPPVSVDVPQHARLDNVRLVVDPRVVELAGTVTRDGAPAADAHVLLVANDPGRRDWTTAPSTTTERDGRFRFRVTPGAYRVVATSDDHRASAETDGAPNVQLALAATRCPHVVAPSTAPMNATWDDRIALIGVSAGTLEVGKPAQITLVWRALAPLDHAWTLRVGDTDVETSCATTAWQPGDTIVDTVAFTPQHAGPITVGWRRYRGDDAPLALAGAAATIAVAN